MRILRRLFIIYNLHFPVLFAYQAIIGNKGWGDWPIPAIITAVFGLLSLVYEVIAQSTIVKRSLWVASLISASIALLGTVLALEYTGGYLSPYVLGAFVITFLIGALGPYLPFGVSFMFLAGLLLFVSGVIRSYGEGISAGLIFIVVELGTAVGSYLFWRRRTNIHETPELAQLNKLLNSSETQSNLLLQSVTDGVIVTDVKGTVTLINPTAVGLCGWKESEAKGIDASLIMKFKPKNPKEPEAPPNPFKTVVQTQKPESMTVELENKETSKSSIISLVVSPIISPDTKEIAGTIAIFRDISDAAKEEQRRAEFISTASHEMRTPVAAIEGYLALAMNDRVSKVDAKARDYLEKAHASTQHLGKLFQDLLTSAKAEDGRLSSHPVVIEMGQYLEQLTADLRFAAEKKGLKTEFIIGSEGASTNTIDARGGGNLKVVQPIYYTYADPDRLREVVTNLFDNAVKYTEAGKVSIGITGNNDVVQFYIKDTGPGIPAQDLPHLFQKFYRVDSSATRTIGGTGLGLFICRKIVELYQGRIWVESELGKGSTFYINLPRLNAQRATELQTAQTSQVLPNPPISTPTL